MEKFSEKINEYFIKTGSLSPEYEKISKIIFHGSEKN